MLSQRILPTALVLAALPIAAAQAGGPKVSIVAPDGLYDPAPYGYSHVTVAEGANRMVFVAGQGGEKLGEEGFAKDFRAQVRQAYANLGAALEASGAAPTQVTKLTTYVVDYDQSLLPVMTEELKHMFGDHLPAQTLVPVPRLAIDGMLFEVDAVAVTE